MTENTAITLAERSRKAALDRLQTPELTEYDRYCRSGKPDLALEMNKRLYGLYLNGFTMHDMLELNPGLNLGAIIKARVDGRWDERRDAYLGELLADIPSRVRQMAAEALSFMSLQLAVTHKEHGAAMKRYLQTGDPNDLKGFRIVNFKDYKQVIESISRLLEAGKSKGSGDTPSAPLVNVNVQPGSAVTLSPGIDEGTGRRFTAEDADAIRKYMEEKGSKGDGPLGDG